MPEYKLIIGDGFHCEGAGRLKELRDCNVNFEIDYLGYGHIIQLIEFHDQAIDANAPLVKAIFELCSRTEVGKIIPNKERTIGSFDKICRFNKDGTEFYVDRGCAACGQEDSEQECVVVTCGRRDRSFDRICAGMCELLKLIKLE